MLIQVSGQSRKTSHPAFISNAHAKAKRPAQSAEVCYGVALERLLDWCTLLFLRGQVNWDRQAGT
jgi:hypothetical protein